MPVAQLLHHRGGHPQFLAALGEGLIERRQPASRRDAARRPLADAPKIFAIERPRSGQQQRIVECAESQRARQAHLEGERPGHGRVMDKQVLHPEPLDPGNAAAVEIFGQAEKHVCIQRRDEFIGDEATEIALLRVAAADQFAGDPAQRIGVVPGVIARSPVRLLPRNGRADGVFVTQIVEPERKVDRRKAGLFGQCLAHGDRAFAMRCELGPDIGHWLVIGEQSARYRDRARHAGDALGPRIDESDIVALPFAGARLVLPPALQVGHGFAMMDDRACRAQRRARLDRGGKGMRDRFETGRDIATRPIGWSGLLLLVLNACAAWLLHRRPPGSISARSRSPSSQQIAIIG